MRFSPFIFLIYFVGLNPINSYGQENFKIEFAVGGAFEAVKTSHYSKYYNNHHSRSYSDVSEIRVLNANPELGLYLTVNDQLGIKLAVNSGELFEETNYYIKPYFAFFATNDLVVDKSKIAFGVAFDMQKYYTKLEDKTTIGSQKGIGAFLGIHGKRLKTEFYYSHYGNPRPSSCFTCSLQGKYSNHSFTLRVNYAILRFKNN